MHKDLHIPTPNYKKVFKGKNVLRDSYSGFGCDGDDTGLLQLLTDSNIDLIFVVGLAFDYCVSATALDPQIRDFQTWVITDLTRSISPEGEKNSILKYKPPFKNLTTSDKVSEIMHSKNKFFS